MISEVRKFKVQARLIVKLAQSCSPSLNLTYTQEFLQSHLQTKYLIIEPGITGTVKVSGCDQGARRKRRENTLDINILLSAEYT